MEVNYREPPCYPSCCTSVCLLWTQQAEWTENQTHSQIPQQNHSLWHTLSLTLFHTFPGDRDLFFKSLVGFFFLFFLSFFYKDTHPHKCINTHTKLTGLVWDNQCFLLKKWKPQITRIEHKAAPCIVQDMKTETERRTIYFELKSLLFLYVVFPFGTMIYWHDIYVNTSYVMDNNLVHVVSCYSHYSLLWW